MYLQLSLLVLFSNVFKHKSICAEARNNADFYMPSSMNAILLKCPKDKSRDWPCEPQLIVNINFTPNLNVEAANKLLILDETYEPTTRQNLKIMSPYVITVSRKEPIVMYPLQISKDPYVLQNDLNSETRRIRKIIEQNKRNSLYKKKETGQPSVGLSGTNAGFNDNLETLNNLGEKNSYTTFNLNEPFSYLEATVKIFRKRNKIWWRILPEVTLNNLSGTFVNGSLSMLLTSHDDILKTRKSSVLENHKLLIPTNYLTNLKEFDGFLIPKNLKRESVLNAKTKRDNQNELKKIKDLEKCPYNNKILCLNVLDDQVPAYSIKIKLPFRENAAQQNIFKIKIARIVSDATVRDALQISVDVINKGLEAHEFIISIGNCPLSDLDAITSVKKLLFPYISETITFLLPFIFGGKKNYKLSCDVIVRASIMNTLTEMNLNKSTTHDANYLFVSKRSINIESYSRCFCIWNCRCHCIGKIENHVDGNVCYRMSPKAEKNAGLLLNCPPYDSSNDLCLMDPIKQSKNKQSQIITADRIVIAILVLIVILFIVVICCCKCFKPRKEDLLIASTEWHCCPEKNLSTGSQKESMICVSSLSVIKAPRANNSAANLNPESSDTPCRCVSQELPNKCKPIDSLESALITLTRQQRELKKNYSKKE